MNKRSIVIEFAGGLGVGKTTLSSAVAAELKNKGMAVDINLREARQQKGAWGLFPYFFRGNLNMKVLAKMIFILKTFMLCKRYQLDFFILWRHLYKTDVSRALPVVHLFELGPFKELRKCQKRVSEKELNYLARGFSLPDLVLWLEASPGTRIKRKAYREKDDYKELAKDIDECRKIFKKSAYTLIAEGNSQEQILNILSKINEKAHLVLKEEEIKEIIATIQAEGVRKKRAHLIPGIGN